MPSFKFNLTIKETNNELHMEVNVDNWKDYRNTMKTFQKGVNEYLTELVNLEKRIGG